MNITLTAGLSYPNNTFSSFYCELNKEINISGPAKVAVTDFLYPVNYLVNLGYIELSIPDYLIYNEIIENINFSDLIKNLKQNREVLKYEIWELWKNEADSEKKRISLDQIVKDFESNLNSYIFYIRRLSKDFKDFNFNSELFDLISIFEQLYDYHKKFNYIDEYNKSFLSKIFETIHYKIESLNLINQNVRKNIKIYFETHDCISKKEFAQYICSNLVNLCTFKNDVIKLNNFVEFIYAEPSLLNYITVKNNIISYKKVNHVKYFLISTDIIANTFGHGDNESILRIVKPRGGKGDQIHNSFDSLQFEPINKTRITKVFIKITDDKKNIIKFLSGPIIIKLVFSKK